MKGTMLCVICTLTLLLLIFFSGCNSNIEYPAGRDTINSYGDGTFQIIGNRNTSSGLFFEEGGSPLISHIERVHVSGNTIYLIGWDDIAWDNSRYSDEAMVLAVINEQQNTIRIHYVFDEVMIEDRFLDSPKITYLENYEEFSQGDRSYFQEMLQGKIGNTYELSQSEQGEKIYPFALTEYRGEIENHAYSKNVDIVPIGKVALDKSISLWEEEFGKQDYSTGRDNRIFFDKKEACWCVVSSPVDNNATNSTFKTIVNKNGDVLAVWVED